MVAKTPIIAVIALLPLTAIFLAFFSPTPNNYRLPNHIWPLEYTITIQPFLEEVETNGHPTQFAGDVKIRIQSLIVTNYLVIHSRNLSYNFIRIWAEKTPFVKRRIKRCRFDLGSDRIFFDLEHRMIPSYVYILHLNYTGLIGRESDGLFLMEVGGPSNRRKFLGTQFQPHEARTVIPCFDEPQFKATFQLNIVRPRHMNSYSNSRQERSLSKGNLLIDVYEKTPIMPIYAVGFFIGSLGRRTDGQFSVLARTEKFAQTQYCFDLGRVTLEALGDYFNMSYYDLGIDKMTIVHVPNINFNGMENWGLVALNEDFLLEEDSNNGSSLDQKQRIQYILGHELAHMWFGNLVTCDWWTSVWLNEGFASYFAFSITETMKRGSSIDANRIFFEENVRSSLNDDVGDVHAINFERRRVSRAYFNQYVYKKGSSIVHMARNIMGDNSFQNSIRKYLQVNKYQTVTTKDLQAVWQDYWPIRYAEYLSSFLKSFVEQSGYPLITVHFYEKQSFFEVSQERFPAWQHEVTDPSTLYTVPISFTTDSECDFARTVPAFFLNTKQTNHELPRANSPAKWIIANIQATWYYRVNYNDENWLRIAGALSAPDWCGVHSLNRMQIVDDIQHLFCVGKVNSSLALKVLGYLRNEVDYLPWKLALKYLDNILRYSTWKQQTIEVFMREITAKAYQHLGFLEKSTDDWSSSNSRLLILPLACKYGNAACLKEVVHYLQDKKEILRLPNYLRLVVYCTSIRTKNETFYDELFNLYRREDNNDEKELILAALGCSRDPKLIEKHYWNILGLNVFNDQKLSALKSLYSECDNNAFEVYKLITKNYRNATEVLGTDTAVAKIISEISKTFSQNLQKEHLNDFSQAEHINHSSEALKTLKEAIETLNKNQKCP